MNTILVSTEAFQRIKRAFQQPTRDEFIPAAGYYSKAEAFGIEVSFVNRRLQTASTPQKRIVNAFAV
jgi:hypothetical protein